VSGSLLVERHVPIDLRDGTRTYCDIYRPASGAAPAILQRTPYRKDLGAVAFLTLDPLRAVELGFALVVQDVRGRHSSDGEFSPFFQEIDDGYDSVEWCASQAWCDGNVGMVGASYAGVDQLLAAIARPPHLRCIVPMLASSDFFEGWTYQGGALQWGFMVGWVLPMLAAERAIRPGVPESLRRRLVDLVDQLPVTWQLPPRELPLVQEFAPYFDDWLDHSTRDDYWRSISIEDRYADVAVPSLNVGGWYDIFKDGTLRNFVGLSTSAATESARAGTKLLMGPWSHSVPTWAAVGVEDFGLASSQHVSPLGYDLEAEYFRFFRTWLQGADGEQWPQPVRLFTMGVNSWRYEEAWPPPGTVDQSFFLHSGGSANTRGGDGRLSPHEPASEPPDSFVFDSRSPVPTSGGDLCCYPSKLTPGPMDQTQIEDRADVLVYVGEPTSGELEITGPVRVELWAATSGADTDFTAKLVKVQSCGRVLNITDGILRASFRQGLEGSTPVIPDEPALFDIELGSTSIVLRAGDRFAVEISSSNFPRFDRNPHGHPAHGGPSRQQVFHDATYPSRLVLPVATRRA
jgi:uncharacterized protein